MQTRILCIMVWLLVALSAHAQFGNLYFSSSSVTSTEESQGFILLDFSDSIPFPDTIKLPYPSANSWNYRFFSNNQGHLTAYLARVYETNDIEKDFAFLWPSNHSFSTSGDRYVELAFLHRDDSTYWLIVNDSFTYHTFNYHTSQITQLDTLRFGFGAYTGSNMVFPYENGSWLIEFIDELGNDDELEYYASYINSNGVKDTVLYNTSDLFDKNHNRDPSSLGQFSGNTKVDKIAWIQKDLTSTRVDDFTFSNYRSFTLHLADFIPQSGEILNTQLLRTDTIRWIERRRQSDELIEANSCVVALAFSPDGRFLYLLDTKPNGEMYFKTTLVQYDIKTDKTVELLTPQNDFLDTSYAIGSRGLYIAPNGKIYVFPNDRNYPDRDVYVIDYPNKKGKDCNAHQVFRTHSYIQNSLSPNYYGKRVHIGQSDGCTPQHRFVNAGDKSFTHLRWHFMDTDSNVLHTLRGDSVKCPPLATGPYLVLLRGEDDNGFVNWHWDSIYYSPPVDAKIALLDSVACEYNSVQFADSSTNAGPTDSLSWKWDFLLNGQILERSDEQHPSLSFSQEGRYSVSLHFSNEICADTATLKKALVVNDGPKPGFALSDTLTCAPARIVLTDSARGAMVSRSFTWSDGFMASTNHERKLTEPARLKVVQRVEGPNGCVSQDSQTLRIRPGIAQLGRPDLVSATVLKPGAVQVRWQPLQQAMGYQLWRLQETPSKKELFLEDRAVTTFLDTQLQTDQQSYQYLLKPIDSCQNVGYPSNLATSLLLQAENQHNRVIILRWNAYETWQNGVREYVVESSENMTEWLPIDASGQLTYPDYRIATLAVDVDTIWYRIKAVEQEGNMQVSTSNVVQVPLTTTLWVPNAFSPNGDGINDLFKVGQFGIKNFHCTIFGRNGQVVAVSQNPDAVWDGMLRDQPAPAGVYQYIIAAVDEKGEELQLNGTVILVR